MNSIHSLHSDGKADIKKMGTKQSLLIKQNVNNSGFQNEIPDTKILKHKKLKKPDKSESIITLFELSEFIKIPESREILASQVLYRMPYNPISDRYKKFREKIKPFFKSEIDISDLKNIAVNAHKSKSSSFEILYRNIKNFITGKEISWFDPPNFSFTYDDIKLIIRPELGLQINGYKYVIKYNLKKDPINQQIADEAIAIMKLFLDIEPPNYTFVVWDIQADQFYSDDGIIRADKSKVLTAISLINNYK